MKLLLLNCCFLLLSFLAPAQNPTFAVRGTVVDSISSQGIELATIVLQKPADNAIVGGVVSSVDGKFEIANVAAGKYIMTTTFMGYVPKSMPVEVEGNLQLGKVQLSSSSTTLNTIQIVAEKNLITKNAEKTVFNVAQSPTNQTGTAEDVLRNMPGVSIDQKGSITVVGKQGVKILVDGLPNALAQSDLQSFLKSIPANAIEAIELITNPSAKYDAEKSAALA